MQITNYRSKMRIFKEKCLRIFDIREDELGFVAQPYLFEL